MCESVLDSIYARIKKDTAHRKKPLVIGVGGAYTSGKTVFAEGLARYLRQSGHKTQLLHYDDFHNPFATIDYTDETEIDAFYNRAFDPDKLVREVLAPLKADGHLRKEAVCINLNTGEYTNIVPIDIDESTVVILEGVLLFRPPLRAYIDYGVYLDISSDTMLKRARERDMPRFGEWIMEKFHTRYIPVQQRYAAEWRPDAWADVVVDNNDYAAPRVVR